ncbi:hypothetical protein C4564_04440 [Candidatus Microgenomates bacterium]|nr:MAG: hypothetical protein C4564_04440 [Candidatus Microgenomates bacterium]
MFKKLKLQILKEIKAHPALYTALLIIIVGATFIRVYRTGQILGFYFDQGRDAIEIWELIHNGDFFLIGPTTGIAGIFRGPFYYYLLAPIYWISEGNPVWAANFLALVSIAALIMLYILTKEVAGRTAGLFAVTIAGFSFYITLASRWLSNPTPMLILSMMLIYFMFRIIDGKRWAWVGLAFVSGVSLFHFGSSGEIFYFPALFIFIIIHRKNWPNKKVVVLSLLAFMSTAAPLILFDIKNNWLIASNIKTFLFEKDSFKGSFSDVMYDRIGFYISEFGGKIFPGVSRMSDYLLFVVGFSFLYFLSKYLKNKKLIAVIMLFMSPLIGLLFFQGNEGNVYGYYLTGYYLVFVLLVGVVLSSGWKTVAGKLFVPLFFYTFFTMNLPIIYTNITSGQDGPTTTNFNYQMKALGWIYNDSREGRFNVDVYVPPVIPYAYDYLFTWQDSKPGNAGRVEERVDLLYTLYEEDPPHPERLDAWLERQKGIGEVEYQARFGGITVQRRKRL